MRPLAPMKRWHGTKAATDFFQARADAPRRNGRLADGCCELTVAPRLARLHLQCRLVHGALKRRHAAPRIGQVGKNPAFRLRGDALPAQ